MRLDCLQRHAGGVLMDVLVEKTRHLVVKMLRQNVVLIMQPTIKWERLCNYKANQVDRVISLAYYAFRSIWYILRPCDPVTRILEHRDKRKNLHLHVFYSCQ